MYFSKLVLHGLGFRVSELYISYQNSRPQISNEILQLSRKAPVHCEYQTVLGPCFSAVQRFKVFIQPVFKAHHSIHTHYAIMGRNVFGKLADQLDSVCLSQRTIVCIDPIPTNCIFSQSRLLTFSSYPRSLCLTRALENTFNYCWAIGSLYSSCQHNNYYLVCDKHSKIQGVAHADFYTIKLIFSRSCQQHYLLAHQVLKCSFGSIRSHHLLNLQYQKYRWYIKL